METKIVYVLVSKETDYFWEQCYISILSLKHFTPEANVVLVCDADTDDTLVDNRSKILDYISEKIVVPFSSNISNLVRSRLLKISLRKLVKGSYLYIDCDTLIVKNLSDIDYTKDSMCAVLDGHIHIKAHPVYNIFKQQCSKIGYNLSDIESYFSGGVIFAKDDSIAHTLYSEWEKLYNIGLSSNMYMDEPSMNSANYLINYPICELPGEWNCQVRFGALYLATARILHFCSKKNMPLSYISTKEFLLKVKKGEVSNEEYTRIFEHWRSAVYQKSSLNTALDYEFSFSREYENARLKFVQNKLANQISQKKHLSSLFKLQNSKTYLLTPKELCRSIRNALLGHFAMRELSDTLYYEKFHTHINWTNPTNLNEKINWMAFNSDITEWIKLADKIRMREYVSEKGLQCILPSVYAEWDDANNISFEALPQKFVLKCNHDNGSSILIEDRYSINEKMVIPFIKRCMKRKFGITTAEPHYQYIKPLVFAEEYIENDKPFSNSIVNYKFFSFNGNAPYCQVIYNLNDYQSHVSEIYSTEPWQKCRDKSTSKYNSESVIPAPIHLDKMLQAIHVLTESIPFCRIDFYETTDKIYLGEFTFMPGCGRINTFSSEFLAELGNLIKL